MAVGVTAGGRFRSWADIQANAARAAEGLSALGVGEDDSVALMLRNDFATFEVNMAASQLGAYAVPINWHFTADEADYILRDCAAKVLIAHADLLAQIAPGVPAGVQVMVVPTPDEIAAAYNIPAERRAAPAGAEWYIGPFISTTIAGSGFSPQKIAASCAPAACCSGVLGLRRTPFGRPVVPEV